MDEDEFPIQKFFAAKSNRSRAKFKDAAGSKVDKKMFKGPCFLCSQIRYYSSKCEAYQTRNKNESLSCNSIGYYASKCEAYQISSIARCCI